MCWSLSILLNAHGLKYNIQDITHEPDRTSHFKRLKEADDGGGPPATPDPQLKPVLGMAQSTPLAEEEVSFPFEQNSAVS